jgi:hypothetical protein
METGRMSKSALARADMVNARVLKANTNLNKVVQTRVASGASYSESLGMNLLERNGLTATAHTAQEAFSTIGYEKTLAGRAYASLMGEEGAAAVTSGMRRLATVEGISGKYSKAFATRLLTSGGGAEMMAGAGAKEVYFAGQNRLMTEYGEKLTRSVTKAFEKTSASELRLTAASRGLRVGATVEAAESLGLHTVEKGILKTLGTKGAMQAVKAGGARVGLAVAGEAALAAIPGVNLIFAADMAYQLGKLGGMAVKGAINLGKDAMKSMQGNMKGGMFGTYKDNETAATSRARGVMAIQNSRLNARSMLGNEGAMMAAHFG